MAGFLDLSPADAPISRDGDFESPLETKRSLRLAYRNQAWVSQTSSALARGKASKGYVEMVPGEYLLF